MAKKCRVCKEKFDAFNSLQFTCGAKCAIEWAKKDIKTKKKKQHKLDKERVKTRGQCLKEAQIEFNKFIRHRDDGDNCICCNGSTNDNHLTGSGWDAGHYLSTGARPNLRFDEDNCHRQLVKCNRFLSGNAASYRIGLVKKIGIDRVEALECNHKEKKYTIDQLKEIKRVYREKTKQLINV